MCVRRSTPIILSVAGSDPLAGAGIQADIKTAAALNAYCCTVVTAVTAQNSQQVSEVWALSPEQVKKQFTLVMEDLSPGAIKLGMLASQPVLEALLTLLAAHPQIPVVMDTVFKSSAGQQRLLEETAVSQLARVIPLTRLITPNLAEAARLLSSSQARSEKEMKDQAAAIVEKYQATAVLLKGGHLQAEEAIDVLLEKGKAPLVYRQARLPALHTHGTGCTLSSAIAVFLAKGESLPVAVKQAKAFTHQAIARAGSLNLVAHNGPLQHFNF